MGYRNATFVCPDCGKLTPRTGSTQKRCHECADRIRHPRTGTGRGKGARLRRRFVQEEKPKTLKGLSIVQVDRLAKELHISYGRLVAGYTEAQMERALGADTPRTR